MGAITDTGAGEHLSVLIVDDDYDIRCLLAELLRVEAYRVVLAQDGESGLQRLREHPEAMVVLLDINMPGVDGVQVLQTVYADPTLARRHAFIVMTGQYEDLPRTLATVLADMQVPILCKPFHIASVLDAIAKAERLLAGRTGLSLAELG